MYQMSANPLADLVTQVLGWAMVAWGIWMFLRTLQEAKFWRKEFAARQELVTRMGWHLEEGKKAVVEQRTWLANMHFNTCARLDRELRERREQNPASLLWLPWQRTSNHQ